MTDASVPPNPQQQIQALLNECRQLAAKNGLEALERANRARELARRLPDDTPGAHELRGAAAQDLGVLYQRVNDSERALTMYREAEASIRQLPEAPHARLLLAATQINLGGLQTRQRQFDDALATLADALLGLDQVGDANAGAVAIMRLSALQNRAAIELERRELNAGAESLRAAVELGEAVATAAPQLLAQVIDAGGRLLQVLKAQGKPAEGVAVAERSARWAEAASEGGATNGVQLYVATRFQLVDAHVFAGSFAEAESHLWKALDVASTPQTLLMGTDFYCTLLRLTDTQLTAGDLPRDEIGEALVEVLDKMSAAGAPEALMELARARQEVLGDGRVDRGVEILERTSAASEPVLQQLRAALKSDVDWRIKQAAGA